MNYSIRVKESAKSDCRFGFLVENWYRRHTPDVSDVTDVSDVSDVPLSWHAMNMNVPAIAGPTDAVRTLFVCDCFVLVYVRTAAGRQLSGRPRAKPLDDQSMHCPLQ